MFGRPGRQREVNLILRENRATSLPASDIYVVQGTNGNYEGVTKLIQIMGSHGLLFYKSEEEGLTKGPSGLISKDDVIIIKVNSQWDERGGTNTDLLRALIKSIIEHPDGFIGEIIVADNGQAQYGSAPGGGGSFNYALNNAENTSQSVQEVVNYFAGSHKVSTYLWDTITTKLVKEYFEGDMEDGYIVNTTRDPETGIMVSYPKFRTKFGTYVSFKLGIWDPNKRAYDSERLKVINMPVLKSHSIYGVTACVKHYMGVVSDKLTSQFGQRAHNTVGTGGMGTQMVETRFPTLNILDAIWVNAIPGNGPRTRYSDATKANVIAASIDPVALDYWASKYILLQIARINGYSRTSSLDPDYAAPGSFGNWLRLSMQEITRSGYQATVDETRMNVYLAKV
ncbi:MAG: DUF362 domain-containing protein [Nitrososphaerota archaeon]|nr:DUF362 domain-containing protein [Candidatus Bathyarchaeota archaeon]MDW8048159.1 DUF362 domain-containing protein [Nitrososphaerota archaeon]